MTSHRILYGLDDRPPPAKAVVFACQHVLTMFGATVAVPLMFAPMLWPVDLAADQMVQQTQRVTQLQNTALLIWSVMLCSGLATMIQSTWGSRLPIIQGVSISFLTAFAYIIAKVWSEMLPEMLHGIVTSIGLTGMAVAAIIGITLDNLIPGTPEERGLVPRQDATQST